MCMNGPSWGSHVDVFGQLQQAAHKSKRDINLQGSEQWNWGSLACTSIVCASGIGFGLDC